MKLECEYCFNSFVIRPDEKDTRINFCPHCGEPIDDDNELDFHDE